MNPPDEPRGRGETPSGVAGANRSPVITMCDEHDIEALANEYDFICRTCGTILTWEWWMKHDQCPTCLLRDDDEYAAWCQEQEERWAAEMTWLDQYEMAH